MIPPERRAVAVRAFATRVKPIRRGMRRIWRTRTIPPSDIGITFDTETGVDAAQQVRVGGYMVHKANELREAGLFYDPESLNRPELRTIRSYARVHRLELLTLSEFVDRVFYGIGYQLNATIIGFNLPFDVSRLALAHGSARGRMRGGFTFRLTTNPRWPNVQIKHLSNRAALIRFAAQRRQRTPRSVRKRGSSVPVRRGFFSDVKTLAGTLVGGSHSLASLSRLLQTPERKEETDKHGEELTESYLDYLMRDVRVTRWCFESLRDRYASFGLSETQLTKLYSEASLGKALLRQIGIERWRKLQPAFPRRSIGRILSTYYGGRSEVRLRRLIARVLYLDFLSMYPTICARIGLWRFVIAERVRSTDATAAVRKLLDCVTIDDLLTGDLWAALTTIVLVHPRADLFPVRAAYDGVQHTIGLNHLTSDRPVWFTLADCVVSTLLTGKAPEVLKALRYEPVGIQRGLRPLDLFGNPAYRVDPYTDDLFVRIIELRSQIKRQRDAARHAGDTELAARLDAEQEALKTLANATSYGIYVELNVRTFADLQDLRCYGPQDSFEVPSRSLEEPGSYFHPLLASVITGGARLLLGAAEVLTAREGLGWMFCDTDSWALVKPKGMAEREFMRRAERIRAWFRPLSPYATDDELLKIEEVNRGLAKGELAEELEPLSGFAVSDKRYVLFNLRGGQPVIRKASAHGLGHLIAPYGEEQAPSDIPAPATSLRDIGVVRWQHDLWYRIVEAARGDNPDQVRLDAPGFDRPAVSRYAATTPELLRWFKAFNADRGYREQVRPFGFLLAYQSRRKHSKPPNTFEPRKLGRMLGQNLPRAVAPFDRDLQIAATSCFDRLSAQAVPPAVLPTYREALAQYHLNPEDKFLNGDFIDSGLTMRRHIEVAAIEHIGKESERWEEQYFVGFMPGTQIRYGEDPGVARLRVNEVVRAGNRFGRRQLARSSGVSLGEVSLVLRGLRVPSPEVTEALAHGLESLEQDSRT